MIPFNARKQQKLIILISHFISSADWYKDRFSDSELDELENPKPKSTTTKRPTRVRGSLRRKPQPKVVKEPEPEEEEEEA